MINPINFNLVVNFNNRELTLGEHVDRANIARSSIVQIVGQWAITRYGLDFIGPVYQIAKAQLPGQVDYSWVDHMSEKKWVDLKIFKRAYLAACKYHGVDPRSPIQEVA